MTAEKWLVRRWMAKEVIDIRPEDAVVDAFERMQEKRIRHLPVVNEVRQLVGLVTDRDIRSFLPTRREVRQGASAYSEKIQETRIHEIMIDGPFTISPDTTLREAVNLIFLEKISALPVVDAEDHLIGIITTEDLMWALEQNIEDLWAAAGMKPV